jgi:hypothetical protein
MRLSVVVATRDRAHAIAGCLDSIAAALANAAPLDAEIVVVDNASLVIPNLTQHVSQKCSLRFCRKFSMQLPKRSASGEQRSDTISWIGSGAASFRPPSRRQ